MLFENTVVFNFEGAIRGMRNPMDSWDKSDSFNADVDAFYLGDNDKDLALRLIKAGGEHRKFLRQILISVDITAPRYWWAEFDTYKIGTTANSCSTMHKLQSKAFELDMFEIDDNTKNQSDIDMWNMLINHLEKLRVEYNKTKDYNIFRKMKQLLPESFRQKRTLTLNYENLLNMINQRGNHRLLEWNSDFINWAKRLPYSKELIFMGD